MPLERDPNRLEVYHEGRKRKTLVGTLVFNSKLKRFTFAYDRLYLRQERSVPLGPELPLTKVEHTSKPGKLFPSLEDRIPSRENPAYLEYCQAEGISPDEKNPIVLLTTIGRRGPSTFVFEAVHEFGLNEVVQELKEFRTRVNISLWEFAAAFDIPYLTMQRIENGKARDSLTLRLVRCYLSFPDAANWQLTLTGGRINRESLRRIEQEIATRSR